MGGGGGGASVFAGADGGGGGGGVGGVKGGAVTRFCAPWARCFCGAQKIGGFCGV